jgi:hypothetical protein
VRSVFGASCVETTGVTLWKSPVAARAAHAAEWDYNPCSPGASRPAALIWITNAEDARVDNPADSPMTAERGAQFIKVIGRLRPAASVASAQAELEVIAAGLARAHPDDSGNRGVRVASELDRLVGDSGQ